MYDLRSQLWVFGLCVLHVLRAGQLQRLGAITGVPASPQTKTRALIAGLAALAKHTSTGVKVIVQVAAVWEAWTSPKHREHHLDLYQGLARAMESHPTRPIEAVSNGLILHQV